MAIFEEKMKGNLYLVIFTVVAFLLFLLFLLKTPIHFEADLLSNRVKSRIKAHQPAQVKFIDKTLESGLTLVHKQGTKELKGLNETMGSGACVLDYDNDGWVDLYVVNGSGQTRFYGQNHWWKQPRSSTLYKNIQDGKFKNVTKVSGLTQRVWGMGCAVADFDNDGDQDLLTINIGKNELYRNNGDGTFSKITNDTGITGNVWSTSASIADYDRDGFLDIYIVNYINYNKNSRTFEKNKGFKETTPPFFNSALYESLPNKLYRNLGGLRFEEVTQKTGVQDISGRSLSSLWLDINNDLWPDLYVANDQGSPDVFFINLGNGTFKLSENDYKQNSTKSSRNVNAGDIDKDGDLDLFISRVIGEAPSILINGETSLNKVSSKRIKKSYLTDLSREIGVANEITRSFSGWGSGLYDFNNDGWLDLFMVNGLSTPNPDARGITTGQEKLLWLNNQAGNLQRVQGIPALRNKQSARGVVFADFDNDGDIDVYTTHNNDLGQLLINEQKNSNHWLGVTLHSDKSNKDAVGAKVWLETESEKYYSEVGVNQGYMSQSDRRLHFGLSDNPQNIKLKILWPSGQFQEIKNVSSDQYIEVFEGKNQIKLRKYAALQGKQKLVPIQYIKQARHKQQYLEWLLEVYPEKIHEQLKITLLNNEPTIRLLAIQFIQQHKNTENLELLVSAFQQEKDVVNIIATVNALKDYEDEHSIKWLLPLLEEKNPEVQCAVADVFSFFFQEEEAVIIRKYLAIPYLIAMLESSSEKTRECAALALGEAERYRGLMPLIQLLKDPVEDVKIAAIQSLGRIREKEAIYYLLQLARGSNQSIKVLAHVVIALKRLDYEKVDELLQSPLLGNHAESNNIGAIVRHLEVIKAIQANKKDGVVIDQNSLTQVVSQWLTNIMRTKNQYIEDDLLLINVIEVLKNSRSGQVRFSLSKLRKHPSEIVRAKVYNTLILNSLKKKAHQLSKLGLKDVSSAVRKKVLQSMLQRLITLPSKQIISNLKTREDKLAAVPLLAMNQDKVAIEKLLKWTYDSSESQKLRLTALDNLTSVIETKLLPNIHIDRFENNESLTALAIRYQFKILLQQAFIPEVPEFVTRGIQTGKDLVLIEIVDGLITRNEAWSQQVELELLNSDKIADKIKQRLIQQLGKIKQDYANNLLFSFAKLRHHPLNIETIKQLKPKSEKIKKFLWRIVNNKKENEKTRFSVAEQLFVNNKKTLLDELHLFYKNISDESNVVQYSTKTNLNTK